MTGGAETRRALRGIDALLAMTECAGISACICFYNIAIITLLTLLDDPVAAARHVIFKRTGTRAPIAVNRISVITLLARIERIISTDDNTCPTRTAGEITDTGNGADAADLTLFILVLRPIATERTALGDTTTSSEVALLTCGPAGEAVLTLLGRVEHAITAEVRDGRTGARCEVTVGSITTGIQKITLFAGVEARIATEFFLDDAATVEEVAGELILTGMTEFTLFARIDHVITAETRQ